MASREPSATVAVVVVKKGQVVLLRRESAEGFQLCMRRLGPGGDPAQLALDSVGEDLGVTGAMAGVLGRFRGEDGLVLAYVVQARGEIRPGPGVAEVLLVAPDALELRVALPAPGLWPLGEIPLIEPAGAPLAELVGLMRMQQVESALELAHVLAAAALQGGPAEGRA